MMETPAVIIAYGLAISTMLKI